MARNIYYKKRLTPLAWLLIGVASAAVVTLGIVLAVTLSGDPAPEETIAASTESSITTEPTTTAPLVQTVVVTADTLNVRQDASKDSKAIGHLKKGDEVIVLAEENGWYRIDFNNGYGFISAEFTMDTAATGTDATTSTTVESSSTTKTTTSSATKKSTTGQKYTDRYIDEDGMLQFKPGNNYVQANSYPDGNIPYNLLLVNDWNPMKKGYDESVKMKTLTRKAVNSSQKVDARMYDDLMAMLDAGKDYNIGVQSSYRPYATQKRLYWNKVSYYKGIYSDPVVIQTKAGEVVKRPGFSEHNTGLAVDLYGSGDHSLTSSFAKTGAYKWLIENCADYGFVLRFPKGKESITGVIYEAWHFRYVGDPAIAHEIMDNGLCLEEYLAQKGQ